MGIQFSVYRDCHAVSESVYKSFYQSAGDAFFVGIQASGFSGRVVDFRYSDDLSEYLYGTGKSEPIADTVSALTAGILFVFTVWRKDLNIKREQ